MISKEEIIKAVEKEKFDEVLVKAETAITAASFLIGFGEEWINDLHDLRQEIISLKKQLEGIEELFDKKGNGEA